jgi:Fe2+ or Zn2+ uptake regulation protein
MASFRDPTRVKQVVDGQGTMFAYTLRPGVENKHHGIFYCTHCGSEIALPVGHKAPPQNHHQHPVGIGDVDWRLLVLAG